MPRRVFALAYPLLAVLASWTAATAQRPARLPPPNLVWIVLEDVGLHLGCYGDKFAQTPNIDAFAKTAVRYRQAFSHAPVPATSHSGMITGDYPSSYGAHHVPSRTLAPRHLRCFPELLRARGYFCIHNRPLHYQLGPMQFSKDSFMGPLLGGWSPPAAWDAIATIETAHRPAQQPLFAAVSIGRLPLAGKTQPKLDSVPPYLPDTAKVRQLISQDYHHLGLIDDHVGAVLEQLRKGGHDDHTIVWITTTNGRDLPREKRWLYGAGTHIPLLIRVPEKYRGLVFGKLAEQRLPGSANDELISSIDFAPTMLSLAGLEAPDWMRGRAFLGRRAQAAPNYVFAARDRIDEAYDCVRSVYDGRYRYLRNHLPSRTYAEPCLGQDRNPVMQELRRLHAAGGLNELAARLFQAKPLEELYDTRTDPHEIHNLAAAPEHRKRLLAMREAQIQWSLQTGDLGLIPESQFNRFKIQKFGIQRCQPPIFRMAVDDRGRPAVQIACTTEATSPLYQIDGRGTAGQDHWNLYTEPVTLQSGQVLTAKGVGLGRSPSKLSTFKIGDPEATEAAMEVILRAPHWTRNLRFSNTQGELQQLKRQDFHPETALSTYQRSFAGRSSDQRYWALLGIHRLARTPPELIAAQTAYLKALSSNSEVLRATAATILIDDAEHRSEALAAIRPLLHSPVPHAVFVALQALDRCGTRVAPLKADLEKLHARLIVTEKKLLNLPPPLRTSMRLCQRVLARAKK